MLSGGNRTGLKELEIVAAAWCWVSEFLVGDLAMLLFCWQKTLSLVFSVRVCL